MRYFIDDDGILLNTINEDDKVKIVRKETLDFIKSEDDKIEINVDANFIKLYTNTLKDLINENLTSSDLKVILVCLEHLRYDSGAVTFENTGEFLSQQDIIKISKLSKMSVYNSIERLVGKKILHKGTTGKEYQLFMNPFIFMKGIRVNKTLYSMFKKSKWNKVPNKNKRHENPKN